MCDANDIKRTATAERMKQYKQDPENIDAFLQGESYRFEATDEAMMAAAIIRMKLLNLPAEIIEAFEQRGEVKVSIQVYIDSNYDGGEPGENKPENQRISHNGMLFSLSIIEPTDVQARYIKEKKGDYTALYCAKIEWKELPDWMSKNKEYLILKTIGAALK